MSDKNNFKKQFRGYKKSQVTQVISGLDSKILELITANEELNSKNEDLTNQLSEVTVKHEALLEEIILNHQTKEEIARLAIKEAAELIDKAKRNADMILKESLEYVRSLNSEINGFKDQAKEFRESVEQMSRDLLASIDESEVYSLIHEEDK